MAASQSHTFQAEIKQLLHILVHSLYKDREIFLRELISNASDALNRVQFEMLTNPDVLDPETDLYVHITVDKDQNLLRIADTGVGMTADEMIDALGVIARSGARAFLESVSAAENSSENSSIATDIIGQFGVGFYSVFMAAEKVEVISRSYRLDAQAAMWVSTGGEGYDILPADKTTRGTEVVVYLRDDAKEFADEWRLKEIIRRHSDYVQFPIYVGQPEPQDEGEEPVWQPANQQTAIWRRASGQVEEEEYHKFYQSLTFDFDPPALTLHSQGDAPIQYYALLFIPSSPERSLFSLRREPGLKLYARKVLIQDRTTDLLPDYLRFVHGVVDSEDLPLSVSRETIQSNALVGKLRQVLSRRVLSELQRLAGDEPERYEAIWRAWSGFLKQGVIAEFADRERLLPLLRFTSTHSEGGLITLDQYVERMADGQQAIYYLVANDLDSAAYSVHLEPFRERGIEVLYLVETVDGFLIPALGQYKDHEFIAADAADLDLSGVGQKPEAESPEQSLPPDDVAALVEYVKGQLGDQVEAVRVSRVLSGSPARLVAPKGSLDRHQQRLYQMLDKEFDSPPRILEINPSHPIIRNLSARLESNAEDETLSTAVRLLYQNALLADGLHPNPAQMVGDIQALLERATQVNGHEE